MTPASLTLPRLRVAFLTLALGALLPQARADVLVGANGDRFTGRVVEETPEAVVFDSELGGRLTVPRARIREIQRPPPPLTDNRLLITNNTPPCPPQLQRTRLNQSSLPASAFSPEPSAFNLVLASPGHRS